MYFALNRTEQFFPQYIRAKFSFRQVPITSARVAQLPLQNPSVSNETLKPSNSALSISLIGAAAFMRASKLPGSQCYRLNLSDLSTFARSASTFEEPPDLSQIPKKYHDFSSHFANVFSKSKAFNLAPHHLYDLKIDIKEGATFPISPMYQLSQVELQTLCDFIDEHLLSGFICQTSSPHGHLVFGTIRIRLYKAF